MYVFGTNRSGCFVEARLPTKGARGVLMSFGGRGGADDFGSEAIVTGVGFTQREKVGMVQCIGNRTYVYAFGHDPASSAVNLTALVSVEPESSERATGQALKRLVAKYRTGRVSANDLVTITYGNMAIQGVLIEMQSQTADPALNLQTVTYSLLLLKCIGEQ